jgi:hypothetical protein
VKFYFPDSQDLVSPTYDFVHDEYSPLRVRQRDDLYAHEVLTPAPYDGLLVSKTIVDGSINGAGKYSESQRARLYRLGVREYFRLPQEVHTLGDNGAFNYVNERVPPITVEQVLDFYDHCGFDAGVSVDHIIFGYERDAAPGAAKPEWAERRLVTLRLAEEFISAVAVRGSGLEPVGAAQGWSPATYADSVKQLQEMGYRRIALGGMVPLKTRDILDCLAAIDDIRMPETGLHLLGITRVESLTKFAEHGVTSLDSTSPFRQAFMDDRRNYHLHDDAYLAIRVPQVDGNPALKRKILAGLVPQRDAIAAERECLRRLRAYDAQGSLSTGLDDVLGVLRHYHAILGNEHDYEKKYATAYERTLEARPWRGCGCALCERHGIEIVIFRGTERNKRRGFHNLSVLAAKIRVLPAPPMA